VCVCISESGRNKTRLAGKKTHWEEEKTLAKLASKFKKLLPNSKFHSHLASWQVVISTPVVSQCWAFYRKDQCHSPPPYTVRVSLMVCDSTHRASCSDRSASSKICCVAPRSMIVHASPRATPLHHKQFQKNRMRNGYIVSVSWKQKCPLHLFAEFFFFHFYTHTVFETVVYMSMHSSFQYFFYTLPSNF
jgi:hypothetical protein